MLALLASLLIVAYLVVPGLLFRLIFSYFVPLKKFDRTQTEELAFSVVVCSVPFVMALLLVHYTPLGTWPWPFPDTWAQGWADYKTFLLSGFSESQAGSRDELWGAVLRSGRRLARLAFWYIGLVVIEATVAGYKADEWLQRWQRKSKERKPEKQISFERIFAHFFLRSISEWHLLLMSGMRADILTTDDHLYHGVVANYTHDRNGQLTGIYLKDAQRYDRRGLLADRETGKAMSNSDYWQPIPGQHIFVFADKIATLNIRPWATADSATRVARQELDPGVSVTVVDAVDERPAPQAPPDVAVSPPR